MLAHPKCFPKTVFKLTTNLNETIQTQKSPCEWGCICEAMLYSFIFQHFSTQNSLRDWREWGKRVILRCNTLRSTPPSKIIRLNCISNIHIVDCNDYTHKAFLCMSTLQHQTDISWLAHFFRLNKGFYFFHLSRNVRDVCGLCFLIWRVWQFI